MNTSTKYMGLSLASPIVVSSCPLSVKLDNIKKMEECGAGAVVLFSIFEEQIRQKSKAFEHISDEAPKFKTSTNTFFPEPGAYHMNKDAYLEHIRQAKKSVDMPVIASLNGATPGGWTKLASEIEQAGADALELNIFFIPTNLKQDSVDIEIQYKAIVEAVKNKVTIPIAVKLNPYFSSVGYMAKRLSDNGAAGLVLFNRFYEPDFDIDSFEVQNDLELSSAVEIRLPLLWLGVLHGNVKASLAASTGVEGSKEVIKYLLAGADVVMTASALLRNDITYLSVMNKELIQWLEEREFDHVDDIRGIMSRARVNDPGAYERANYIKILQGY